MPSLLSNRRVESPQIKVLNVVQKDLGHLLLERADSIEADMSIELYSTVYACGIP